MSGISQVVVVGCGAIGLPIAVAFASRGCDVVGIDTDPARLAALRAGRVADLDEGLGEAFAAAAAAQRLSFCGTLTRADAQRAFIVAVPTPVDADAAPILTNVEAAIESIAANARGGDLVLIRATVPIGMTRRMAHALGARGKTLLVAACPDRSIAGRSLREQFSVPHIVGGMGPEATRAAASLFARLGPVVELSSPEAAEAAKLFANVQRDVTFALANQFALVSETLNLDFDEIVRAGSSGYPRFSLARPGPVAGPCLTKDSAILAHSLPATETLDIARAARALNVSLLGHVANAVEKHIDATRSAQPSVAVLGLAFKGDPPTADRRGSFGSALAERLRADLTQVALRTFEPTSDDAAERHLARAIAGADVVVIANDHPEIKALDVRTVSEKLRPGALIYDVCCALAPVAGALPNAVTLRRLGNGRRPG